jgi:hypothetical protein
MILYLTDPKNSTKNQFENKNSFVKVARYKINIQKSVVFYMPTTHRLRNKWEIIPFTIASETKYLGKNLKKETKDLFNENYKALKREIKEDFRRWKELPCSWIGRINIVKMAQLPNMLNKIPNKIPMTFCTEIEK